MVVLGYDSLGWDGSRSLSGVDEVLATSRSLTLRCWEARRGMVVT